MCFIIVAVLMSCKSDKNNEKTEKEIMPEMAVTSEQDIELDIYDFEGLKPFFNKDDDKIYVINFWATWCAPCVKELPYFEKLNAEYSNKGVELLLVSLDFPRQYDTKLKPFLKEKQLTSKVVVLDDVDANTWIPAVDEEWSGAIPATYIYKGDKSQFYEGSLTYEELETEIQQFLN